MRNITIQVAGTEHLEHIARHNIAMAFETENLQLDPQLAIAGVEGLLARPQFGFYLMATIDGLPAASLMITYEWSDWRNGVIWWVQSVYVRPEYRSMGVFKQMYVYLQNMAKQEQVPALRLYVDMDNKPAQAVYAKLGWHTTHYAMLETEV